ncbi:MAG: OmpW family outer membrane protein [Thermoanaerobaculia bacterium]
MKRYLWILAVVVLAATGAAWASSVSVTVSQWATDHAGDDSGLGFKLGLSATPNVDIEVRVAFFDMLLAEGPEVFEVEAFPVELGLSYNFRVSDKANPYVGGGVGYYELDAKGPELPGEFGWYLVGGIDVPISKNWLVFAEGLYRQVEAQAESDDLGRSLIKQELNLSGAAFNLGIGIRW